MQWLINETESVVNVIGRKDENFKYEGYAVINEQSQLVFYGDFSDETCSEIEKFLETQGIYIDENGYAYGLTN